MVSERCPAMGDGVTTRLQKEVSQLQKDVTQLGLKLDGVAEQIRSDLTADLEKMIVGLLAKLGNDPAGKSISGVTEPGTPGVSQKGNVSTSTMVLDDKSIASKDLGTSNFSGDSGRQNTRKSKLDCPKFDGYDFLGWKLKIEQYFEAVSMLGEDKVQTVMIHLEGKALQWHQRFMKHRGSVKMVDWEFYVKEMRARFCDNEFADPMSELVSLKQSASVEEYYEEFESLLNLLDLTDDYSLSVFVSNLKPEIAKSVRLFSPKTMTHAFTLAKQVESMLYTLPRKPYSPYRNALITQPAPTATTSPRPYFSSTHNNLSPSHNNLPPLLPTPKIPPNYYTGTSKNIPHTSTTSNSRNTYTKPEFVMSTRSPTREERDDRRRRGLCMWCGVKFTPGHSCPRSQLYQLLVEDCDSNEEPEIFSDCVETMEENVGKGEEMVTIHTISVQALLGSENCQTMRLQGRIKNQLVIVLVDSGSTHNFIDSTVAKRLGCALHTIKELQVTVANGTVIHSHGACKELQWEVQGFQQLTDFYVLPLQGCDLVLGIHWLKTLGPIVWDFKALTMQFVMNQQTWILKGLQGGDVLLATKKQLAKMNYTGGRSLYSLVLTKQTGLQLGDQPESDRQDTVAQWELQSLLNTFAGLFEIPTSLPPQRSHDHAIPLKDETQVVKVRPYRYPAA